MVPSFNNVAHVECPKRSNLIHFHHATLSYFIHNNTTYTQLSLVLQVPKTSKVYSRACPQDCRCNPYTLNYTANSTTLKCIKQFDYFKSILCPECFSRSAHHWLTLLELTMPLKLNFLSLIKAY